MSNKFMRKLDKFCMFVATTTTVLFGHYVVFYGACYHSGWWLLLLLLVTPLSVELVNIFVEVWEDGS